MIEVDVAIGKEHGIAWLIESLRKCLCGLTLVCAQLFGITQNVMPERMPLEDNVLKKVVYQFGRRVVVALYLVAYHFNLLVNLSLRILAMEDDIREQIHCLGEMLLEDGGIINGVLLVGEGIQFASQCLQTVDDGKGATAFCALKSSVLAEMGNTLLARQFIARSGIDAETAIYYLRRGRKMYYPQSVRESGGIVFQFIIDDVIL